MQPPALGTDDWLDLALQELKDHGYGALRALPLAKKLKVTRGSFYHHFESLDAFHKAVIGHWAERSSGDLIKASLEADDPQMALNDLLQLTLRSGAQLERAVRSWATVHPLVAIEVEKIDEARIKTAEGLLLRNGVPKSAAATRSKVLYWAAIGRMMLPFPEHNLLTKNEITKLTSLMLGK